MSGLYAMQRANGDWFALDDHGRLRMPVFRSLEQAKIARSRDSGMECFRPVMVAAHTLPDLKTGDGSEACFSIVDDPSINLNRGGPLDFEQFSLLIQDLEKKR
jgi:hypothetical protein